jgi:hypothetical protein
VLIMINANKLFIQHLQHAVSHVDTTTCGFMQIDDLRSYGSFYSVSFTLLTDLNRQLRYSQDAVLRLIQTIRLQYTKL